MKPYRLLNSYLSFILLCCIGSTTSVQAANRDEVIFFFNDAQGSAIAAVNEAGELCWSEEFTAYGDKNINDDLISTVGCGIVGEERGFTGHAEDVNSDLVYMQQRYYDPSIGRFLSIDPIEANPNHPKTFNRYAYANNNPYKYTDPNGELPVLVIPFLIAAFDAAVPYAVAGAAVLGGSLYLHEKGYGPLKNQSSDNGTDGTDNRDLGEVIGKLREASEGEGNFNLGEGTREESEELGKAWVGDRATIRSDGRTVLSEDGLRQYRPPTNKNSEYADTGVQSNFQKRPKPSGTWESNGHLNITD